MATIADITLDELKQLIEDTVDARLTAWLGEFEIAMRQRAIN